MKVKIFVNILLFLVACSLAPPVNLGNNTLGFDNAEVDMRVIGATSLSAQQNPDCSIRPLLEGCKLKANGEVIVVTSDLSNPPLNPNTITSQVGFRSASLDFSFANAGTSANDLPNTFTFKELSAEFWAQDGVVNERPSNPDFTLDISLSESDLVGLLFVKASCTDQKCDYTVADSQSLISIRITQASDFLDVFTNGNNQNTAGLILEAQISEDTPSIPDNSILTLILTNPKTTANL